MPELPEVETTLRGLKPHIIGQKIDEVIVRHPKLRWPIPDLKRLEGKKVKDLKRRGKYLLVEFDNGTLILHLGMSGRICVLSEKLPPKKHDHVDIHFANKKYLRFTDPRRFGAVLWADNADKHPLIKEIGPEPLLPSFNGKYLLEKAKGRKVPIKSFVMNSKIVAGVGNIYAVEALFDAGIYPLKPAGKITLPQFNRLVKAIKSVLTKAIKKGGTTLKDFTKSDGEPGYFSFELKAYGREGEKCKRCKSVLKSLRLGNRATVYCGKCQR